MTGLSSKTLFEVTRTLTGESARRRNDADRLRGMVAITSTLQRSGLGKEAFARRYIAGDGSSGLLYKWLRGDVVPQPRSIERLEAAFPGTAELLGHPFFKLLADQPLTVGQIRKHLRRYEAGQEYVWAWQLRDSTVLIRSDTRELRTRGDLDGATVILGLVREAEALGRTQDHMSFIADLYRSLPSLAALPGFRAHLRLLWWCVQRIHMRDPVSQSLVRPHWGLLRVLSSTKMQEPMRLPHYRDRFWRAMESENVDLVEFVPLQVPPLLHNPLRD